MPVKPEIERHPLQPFLPENARLLMLGSFPPPRERWCMEFFYPNPQNDMWRIMGQVFYGDNTRFVEQGVRSVFAEPGIRNKEQGRKMVFKYEDIVTFCRKKGIAIFDTAQAVIRLQGNAADEHLEIVEQTDIAALLRRIPLCLDICCTGGKAAETLAEIISHERDAHALVIPKTGGYVETAFAGRTVRFWRMPSSSRAYPLSLDRKAAAYRKMFEETGLL